MAIDVIVSLPHPRDAVVNYALLLLSQRDTSRHYILHKESNETPVQRHIRNLLQGVNSRRDNIVRGTQWLDRLQSEFEHVVMYNRFSLADCQNPSTHGHIENFLQLFSLYFPENCRLIFIDYGSDGEESRQYCVSELYDHLKTKEMSRIDVNRRRSAFLSEWSFSIDRFLARSSAILGPDRLPTLMRGDTADARHFLRTLAQSLNMGCADEKFDTELTKASMLLQRKIDALDLHSWWDGTHLTLTGIGSAVMPQPLPVALKAQSGDYARFI